VKHRFYLAVLGVSLALAVAPPSAARAQNLDPTGSWKISPFEGCTGTLTVAASSGTWVIDCVYEGKPASANETLTRQDLGNGEFQFDVVADKSTASNYTMDSKLILKMSGACSGSVDIVEPGSSDTFKASRGGPGC
jgi:hypothetical protein